MVFLKLSKNQVEGNINLEKYMQPCLIIVFCKKYKLVSFIKSFLFLVY